MNRKKEVLIISSQKDTTLDDIANSSDFNWSRAGSHEEAIELCHRCSFDFVLADKTDHAIDHKKLQAVLPILHEHLQLLYYQGETTFELERKLKRAVEQRKMERLQRLIVMDSSGPSLASFSAN
ncbi:MAG: hypothetical protein ACJ75B_08460 [Flavisolibacter sp.]